MDEIRGAERVARKMYSYTLTEIQRLRNEEVRHLRKSDNKKATAIECCREWWCVSDDGTGP